MLTVGTIFIQWRSYGRGRWSSGSGHPSGTCIAIGQPLNKQYWKINYGERGHHNQRVRPGKTSTSRSCLRASTNLYTPLIPGQHITHYTISADIFNYHFNSQLWAVKHFTLYLIKQAIANIQYKYLYWLGYPAIQLPSEKSTFPRNNGSTLALCYCISALHACHTTLVYFNKLMLMNIGSSPSKCHRNHSYRLCTKTQEAF